MSTDWFRTTPEATLRAESALTAFREDRIGDIGAMLAQDYEEGGTTDPLHLLVAMLGIADRLANYATVLHQAHHGIDVEPEHIIHEAMSVVAEAAINGQQEHTDE